MSPALNLHFAREAMGDIVALGNAAGANPATEAYSYDALYRLTGLSDANGNLEEAYTYSKTGDRLSKTASGLDTGIYSYQSGTHHLTSIGNAGRVYDANGNTTGSVVGGNTYGFGYNGRNRATITQLNGSTVGTYTYNALGQRVAKVATLPVSTNQRFVYDEGSQLLSEYGSSTRDYIWLDGLPVATVDTTGGASTVSYVAADGLNTPRAVSDSNGNTVWQWSYQGNPFGEQPPTSANGYTLNMRFPGQYYDAESGLNYNVHRHYEPAIGGYDQPDPLGLAAGPSLYAYVSGNPLSATDPLGLMADTTLCVGMTAQGCMGMAQQIIGGGANLTVGVNETAVGTIVGEQGETGFGVDTNGNMCYYGKVCTLAPPLGGGVDADASVAVGMGMGTLQSGDVKTVQTALSGGDVVHAGGAVETDHDGNLASSHGFFGAGGGMHAGVWICKAHYYCAFDPKPKPAPKKACP